MIFFRTLPYCAGCHLLKTNKISIQVVKGGNVANLAWTYSVIRMPDWRHFHHALMTAHTPLPIDTYIGIAFNKKYVWPGFHWFTVGEHVRALEQNGFQIDRAVNLTPHYAKTSPRGPT